MRAKTILWTCWFAATIVVVALVTARMIVGGDRAFLLVGETTDGHHQVETTCETCHVAPPFTEATEATEAPAAAEALNEACRNCHEDELAKAGDSHSRKLFRGPRMAVYRHRIDARQCVVCHAEHRPASTRAGGVTAAPDFCAACHAEGDQDVRQARPSHADLAFDTCATAGCHNYHDNRALYEDFLLRHADESWLAPVPAHPLAALTRAERKPSQEPRRLDAATTAIAAALRKPIPAEWAGTGHAKAGVSCFACHAPETASGQTPAEILWTDAPRTAVCENCHQRQAGAFARGRHGMRRHPLLAAPREPNPRLHELLPAAIVDSLRDSPPPSRMTVGEARLPMREAAASKSLDCGSCHQPHVENIDHSAVLACASCHDDAHTRAYFGSPHHALWQREMAGKAPAGAGVSCATCHMPTAREGGGIVANHNQNDTLRPNEKMIRPVCSHCHGLGFAIDALADAELVARNFRGRPANHVESIEWATGRLSEPR